jgi:hypothetical protein
MKRIIIGLTLAFCLSTSQGCVHDTRQNVIAGIVASAAGAKGGLITWATACETQAVTKATSHEDGEARLKKCRAVESKLALDIHLLIDTARTANAANNGSLDTLTEAALKLAADIAALGVSL